MQLSEQRRQVNPTATVPVQPTVAPATVSVAVQNPRHPSQIQIQTSEGVAVRGWNFYSPVASTHGQQASPQLHPAAPPSHPSVLQNDFTSETGTLQSARNAGDAFTNAEVQSHHLETTASRPVVTSTDPAPTLSAPPSSQSQSILLAPEEKGAALYTMRGLAASIKRSLNAAVSSASSDSHSQKLKRSSSIEAMKPDLAVDEQGPEPKAEPEPVNPVAEPPSIILPASLSDVSVPQHEETMQTANGFQIPSSSSRKFVPFSTLTGAVSFDNIPDSVPINQNPAPSPEATGVLEEDLTTSQSTPQPDVLHNHIEDPFISVSQPSFDPLSFPHRTPTPPLAATITTVHDEGEVEEKAVSISPSYPSTPLHEAEIDSQLQFPPSRIEDDVEMSVAPGEDHVQIQLNVASSEFSQAQDNDTLVQEADESLAPSVVEIDRSPRGSPMVEEYPGGETRSSARAPEELARVLPRTSPIRVQSTDIAETSSPSSLPKLPRKSRRKQEFYVAVPPASEWVLRAKHREAERKALMREKAGEFGLLKWFCSISHTF